MKDYKKAKYWSDLDQQPETIWETIAAAISFALLWAILFALIIFIGQ